MAKIIILFQILLFSFVSISCDRSYVSLVSVAPAGGGNFLITYQICLGEGVTGVNRGGESDTRDFAIGIYSNAPISVSAFTPASVSGTVTGTVQTGGIYGPIGAPYNSDETIVYLDLVGILNAFACVNSSVICGNINSRCDTYSFTSSVIPDSIRVFGVEGAGNPVSGCTYENDMMIDFSTALNVTWQNVKVTDLERNHVRIDWATGSEINNDYFIVQKLENEQHEWLDIATVKGMGTKPGPTEYFYIDKYVSNGLNYYRIKQVDFDGVYSLSKTVSIWKTNEGYIAIELMPNPANDVLTITGAKGKNYQITSSEAKVVETGFIETNAYNISIENIDNGMYFIHLISSENQETVKLSICH